MSQSVNLPLWLFLLLLGLALWSFLSRLLVPSVRWFLRRHLNRAIAEVNTRLRIRLQPFKLTKREVLIERLVFDPVVLAAAEAHAREKGMPREVAMATVQRYAREIVPAFNAYVYFRLGYAIARGVARALYRVRLGSVDDEALAAIPANATVVFVINHRSNMDYVLVSYLAAERTALSYAVGEWARVWPLQQLIRSMGAYFVRRNSKNTLYRRVLERYVHMATAHGVTQAVFPEGGLSRDGRLRPPKLGLLDYMLRDFDPAAERDLYFVPVAINYDRVLEDRTLILDTLPAEERKPAPALATTARFVGKNLWLMMKSEWHRFGYACVNFGTPISMRSFVAERQLQLKGLSREERFQLTADLGSHLITEIGRVIPVTPVPMIAWVFVEAGEEGLAELEVKGRFYALLVRLEERGAQIYAPRQDQDYAVHVGLRMLLLRRLVSEQDGLYRAVAEEHRLLEYYANSIRHLLLPADP